MPTSKSPRCKTVPKSLRIDESALIAIDKEAVVENVSSNTLENQILKQFSYIRIYLKNYHGEKRRIPEEQ
ncbi:MAG: hypothetical protein ABSF09_01780 [Candidatus Bathyarchaeia archaeon]